MQDGPCVQSATTRATAGAEPVDARQRTHEAANGSLRPASATDPNVAVIVVTWNRGEAVSAVVGALSRQCYPRDRMDVVIVDNASTDGTADLLVERWSPERIVENPTDEAHLPAFAVPPEPSGVNRAGFRSLTVVRNRKNLGGCGGFNTGFAYVADVLDAPDAPSRPAYVWLVDDDVDLPADALRRLTETAQADQSIGLVGSRTVDFEDRQTTIETTIYFDFERGWMAPDPAPGHPMHEEHRRWVEAVGGTRGRRAYTGLRDVDVLSACSLLARWSAVGKVGFWDKRYFIYCDDADWCLRFAKAGYRVVLNLEAVVFHTNWLQKLTPARAYYSQRNMVWTIQKALPPERLRRATLRWLGSIMLDARKAAMHCRSTHAGIYLRTVGDIIAGRGGKLDAEGPPPVPVIDALEQAGALEPGAEVLVMCHRAGAVAWADELRAEAARALRERGRAHAGPRWIYMVREGLPAASADEGGDLGAVDRIVFRPNKRSKLTAQLRFLAKPPAATVVFDNHCEFPLLRSRANVHIDRRKPGVATVEPDGLLRRLAFFGRWAAAGLRCTLYALTVRPHVHAGRYG